MVTNQAPQNKQVKKSLEASQERDSERKNIPDPFDHLQVGPNTTSTPVLAAWGGAKGGYWDWFISALDKSQPMKHN